MEINEHFEEHLAKHLTILFIFKTELLIKTN